MDMENGPKDRFFWIKNLTKLAMGQNCKRKACIRLFTHTGAFSLNAAKRWESKASVTAVDAIWGSGYNDST